MSEPERMTTEALVLRLLCGHEYLAAPEAARLLDDLKRTHAHELAEKVKAFAEGHTDYDRDAMHWAANYIDPEVSNG